MEVYKSAPSYFQASLHSSASFHSSKVAENLNLFAKIN